MQMLAKTSPPPLSILLAWMPERTSWWALMALMALMALGTSGCDQQEGRQQRTPEQRNQSRKLELDRSFHDFGKILHGRAPMTEFRLRNISKDQLRIVAEQNSCSCADVEYEILDRDGKKVDRRVYRPPLREKDGRTLLTWLEPAETLKLTVRIVTSKRDPVAKQEDSETHLLFEDPDIGEVVLGYRFFIDPPILVDPSPGVRALPISEGATGLESFELFPGKGKKPFRITSIEGTDGLVQLEKSEARHLNGYRYLVKIGPFPAKERNWVRTFWFHTDLEGGYKMKVMIGGEIVRDLEFLGSAGHRFGRFDFSQAEASRLRLRYNGTRDDPGFAVRDLRILDSKGKDVSKFFEASVENTGGKRWDVLLQYKGGLESRRFSGNYQLHSQIEGFEKTDIGVYGYRLEKS